MRTLITLSAVLLLMAPAIAQEPSIVVHAAAPAPAAVVGIDLSGPDTAESGDAVTVYLVGTPAIDLTKPLTEQLNWLMGADAMSAHLLMPGQEMVPLDVEGTIVFASSGATLRPQVHFSAGEPGEYRVVVDWNYQQNQLVEHVVTVEGDNPDPFPDPDPDPDPDPQPTPPVDQLFVMILEETDDRSTGLDGAKLNQHLEGVATYCRSLSVKYQIADDDQPGAAPWLALLKPEQTSRPVLLVSAPALNNRFIGSVSFGETSAATIEQLKKLGVK